MFTWEHGDDTRSSFNQHVSIAWQCNLTSPQYAPDGCPSHAECEQRPSQELLRADSTCAQLFGWKSIRPCGCTTLLQTSRK